MDDSHRIIIKEQIAPAVNRGEASLLLGAGFSIVNTIGTQSLPSGEELKDRLLAACGKESGPRTTLKDAYLYAKRSLDNFDKYFASCFMVSSAHPWQQKIFQYTWGRIYTTNIDNVLNIAHSATAHSGKTAGEFRFFNYVDEGLISGTIGTIPVVTIHGTCLKLEDGFVFSTLEYAKVSSKVLDWHNDLAARVIAGGLIVIGNQLDESDLDTYVSQRQSAYGNGQGSGNWIVTPNPDPIKAENWIAAGFNVINATAEEFFTELYATIKPRTIGEIALDAMPSAKRLVQDVKAMTWFRSAFKLAFDEIEAAQKRKGILNHFITGADPEWLYIVNDAHAQTDRGNELTSEVARMMQTNNNGVGILHVIGPSGSGKTTAIRNTLRHLARSYRFIYEFDNNQSIDQDLLRTTIDGFTEKSIFVFYSSAEYYYAIKSIADRDRTRNQPYCLFILEDRSSDHRKNKRQLNGVLMQPRVVEFGDLHLEDARNIAEKIEEAGLTFDKFSEKPLDARARIILDKEKGFGGDLLSALYSLTTHENFEQKIFQDYQSAESELAHGVLDLVSILHSLGYAVPIDYIAGALNERLEDITKCIADDLAGIVQIPPDKGLVKCRHRVIASYYFDNYIAGKGNIELLSGLLEYLSRQFTIDDIRLHPLQYRIYRDIISLEFVYRKFCDGTTDAERLYHEAQRWYGSDGIFWLQFGRYYREVKRLPEAIDCLRIGLELYNSFQTRHSLGMTLLEQYLQSGDQALYEEGVMMLENERKGRTDDPYPTSTLLHLLNRILRKDLNNQDARTRAVACFNHGMQHFRNDDYFRETAREYLQLQRQE